MMPLKDYMQLAIAEAQQSLREGNKGFGAVVVRGGKVIAVAHDREVTEHDPTSHAERNAIRAASAALGGDLSDCALISTHEPCPICAGVILWAGIGAVAYGCAMGDALGQSKKRKNIGCGEVFQRAGADIAVHGGVLKEQCGVLYRADVRQEVANLRGADDAALACLREDSTRRRLAWFTEVGAGLALVSVKDDLLLSAYRLLLMRLGIAEGEAPIVRRTQRELVFHSKNFCPTLEACNILGLDTRHVCRPLNEASMDVLLKQLHPRLSFGRNYGALRPHAGYCEEWIRLI